MKIKERLAKLIDVKSIMTILLTLVFCYLSVTGRIESDQFLTVFSVVVSFFFGVKFAQDNTQGRQQ